MKNAKKIENTIINTINSKNEKINIIVTDITYEDGSAESFETIDKIERTEPHKFLAQLKDRIGNYDEFEDNLKKWKNEGRYIENNIPLRYVNSKSVYENEDIVKAQEIEISKYNLEDSNVVVVTITTDDGEQDTFTCEYDQLDDILTNKVDNYNKLKKKQLVYFEDLEEIDGLYSTKTENDITYDDLEENDEIVHIDYIVGNNLSEDYAIITVNNGSKQREKKISIEAIGNILSSNDIDLDIVNYYKVENNEKTKIKERKFYKIYNKHIAINEEKYSSSKQTPRKESKKSEKKEQKKAKKLAKKEQKKAKKKEKRISKKKREISRIVFYKYQSGNNEKMRAVLFYNDRSTLDVSKNEAIIEAERVAKKQKIKLEDYETELFDSGFIKVTTYEELYANRNKYKMDARNEIASLTKKDNIFKRVWNKFKGNKIAKRIVAGVTAVAALITGGVLIGKNANKHNYHDDINPKASQVQNDGKNIIPNNNDNSNTINNNVTYTNSYDILNNLKNRNEDRYNYLSNIKDVLYNYNVQEANKYQESGKDTKLAHTFDELAVQYLIYNDISGEEIPNIFGNEFIDQQELMSSFKKGVKQDSLAHNIQTEDIDKSALFKTQDAKDFYNKYNGLFTKMNNCEQKVDKQKCVKTFYNMLREDFPDMENGNYSNVKSYQLVIQEFVQSMQHINITAGNELNEQELKYILGLQDVINERIGQIVTTQNARALVNPEFSEIDTLPQTEDYKDMLIEELEDTDNYYTTEADRNVKNYDSYKEHINGKGKLTKADSKEKEKSNVTSSNNLASVTTNNSDYSNNTNNSNDVTGTYESHSIVVEDENNYSDDEKDTKTTVVSAEDQVTADQDPSNQILTKEDMEVADDNAPSPIITSDENVEEDYTSDITGSISLDDFIPSNEQENSSETVINYDENVTDNNGSLSDNYTNETTTATNAVTPDTALPDPNNETASNYQQLSNEALADMIVENWANQPTANGENITYTMHL